MTDLIKSRYFYVSRAQVTNQQILFPSQSFHLKYVTNLKHILHTFEIHAFFDYIKKVLTKENNKE